MPRLSVGCVSVRRGGSRCVLRRNKEARNLDGMCSTAYGGRDGDGGVRVLALLCRAYRSSSSGCVVERRGASCAAMMRPGTWRTHVFWRMAGRMAVALSGCWPFCATLVLRVRWGALWSVEVRFAPQLRGRKSGGHVFSGVWPAGWWWWCAGFGAPVPHMQVECVGVRCVGGADVRVWCRVRKVGTHGPCSYDNRRCCDCS